MRSHLTILEKNRDIRMLRANLEQYLLRFFFLLLPLLPCSVFATSQQWFTTEDLVDKSKSIVLAACVSADYTEGEGTVLRRVGVYGFQVEEVIKGTPPITGNQLAIRLIGIRPRNAPFRPGEVVLLFLGATTPQGFATLHGAESSVLHVEETGPFFQHPRRMVKGIIKERVNGHGVFHGRVQMPLADFLHTVRAQLRGGKEGTH